MTTHAFKDDSDGYYEVDVPDGEDMPAWTEKLTPCEIQVPIVEVVIPKSVTRLQALVALDHAGHLDTIESYMALSTTPRIQKLAWENAQDFTRESPTVAALALKLGLSASDVDQLFINASQVVA